MSLLHQNPSEEMDDAARGEELTKGTSHVVVATIVAAVLVTIAIAVYVIAGQKPPAATGEILQVWAHPMHTQTSGFDANGAAIARQSFDQVLVFVRVRLRNQSQHVISLRQIAANTTLADGVHTSYAASANDYNRLFLAYPEMLPLKGKALPLDATLQPGQTIEGDAVSSFRIGKPQWDARKNLNFTFAFQYLPSLQLAPRSAVIER